MRRRAKDVMTPAIAVMEPTPYKEIVRLLDHHSLNAVPVVTGDDVLIGVISEADLLLKEEFASDRIEPTLVEGRRRRAERAKARALTARELMTSPVVTVDANAALSDVARILRDRHVKQVPVTTRDVRVLGMVSRRDILRVFLRPDSEIRTEVEEEIVSRTLWMDRSSIRVSVSDGMVTLRGHVEQRSLADRLVELVERLEGVVGVINLLQYHDYDAGPWKPVSLVGRGFALGMETPG